MKRKRYILICLFILGCGICYWFYGLPFDSIWEHILRGKVTGEFSVNVEGEYIAVSEMSLKCVPVSHYSEECQKVKKLDRGDSLKYTILTDDEEEFYELTIEIPGQCIADIMKNDTIRYVISMPSCFMEKNNTDTEIEIKKDGESYIAVCYSTHSYNNGINHKNL